MADLPGYWADKRLNGKPLEPGQMCWVTTIEGQNPIATYGKSFEDIIEKLALNQKSFQVALMRKVAPAPAATPGATPTAPAVRKRMTNDEIFQATADVQNPAKAADAMVRLVSDATGIDLKNLPLIEFGDRAKEWQNEHPEFYGHPGNIKLLTNEAFRAANYDWANVSKESLTVAFHKLQALGDLFEEPIQLPSLERVEDPPNNLHEFPGGSPVQRTEMPRGARFATGTRSTNFRASQERQPRTPKYSPEDIRRMPPSKHKELINSNDPDYTAAVELMARAQASA